MSEIKFSSNLTIDDELRETVLVPLSKEHFALDKAAIYFVATWALSKGLEPRPHKKAAPNWHADSGEPVYGFFLNRFPSSDPVKTVGEYANAGLFHIRERVSESMSLTDIFEIVLNEDLPASD